MVFAGLDRVASRLSADEAAQAGHLHIIATTPMVHGLLPRALSRFRGHPDFGISLQVVVRRELRPHFDQQKFDIALSTYPLGYPNKASEILADTTAVCVIPAGHRLTGHDVIEPADVLDDHFISMPLETSGRQRIDVAFYRLGLTRRLLSEAQNGMMICQLVAAGVGISVVDPFSARVVAPILIRLPFLPAIPYAFRVFFPLQRPHSPLAQDLASIACEVASEVLGGT